MAKKRKNEKEKEKTIEKEEAEDDKIELDLERLAELTEGNEEDFSGEMLKLQQNQFSDNFLPPPGEFVAPVLSSGEDAIQEIPGINLEGTTQNSPANPNISAPPNIGGISSSYRPTSSSSESAAYENAGEAYKRDEDTRFDITRDGFLADAHRVASPLASPARGAFTRQEERRGRSEADMMAQRDELKRFARQQEKYKEIREESGPPFTKRGRRSSMR